MREYRPDMIRFISEDPITKDYPELTPYQFASNTPIMAIDLDGLESLNAASYFYDGMNDVELALSNAYYTAKSTVNATMSAAASTVNAAKDKVVSVLTPTSGIHETSKTGEAMAKDNRIDNNAESVDIDLIIKAANATGKASNSGTGLLVYIAYLADAFGLGGDLAKPTPEATQSGNTQVNANDRKRVSSDVAQQDSCPNCHKTGADLKLYTEPGEGEKHAEIIKVPVQKKAE